MRSCSVLELATALVGGAGLLETTVWRLDVRSEAALTIDAAPGPLRPLQQERLPQVLQFLDG